LGPFETKRQKKGPLFEKKSPSPPPQISLELFKEYVIQTAAFNMDHVLFLCQFDKNLFRSMLNTNAPMDDQWKF